MELVLNKEDIENLIKENYDGVSDMEFEPEEIQIKIKMSLNSFLRKKSPVKSSSATTTETAVKPDKKPKNVMVGGGKERSMMRIG